MALQPPPTQAYDARRQAACLHELLLIFEMTNKSRTIVRRGGAHAGAEDIMASNLLVHCAHFDTASFRGMVGGPGSDRCGP